MLPPESQPDGAIQPGWGLETPKALIGGAQALLPGTKPKEVSYVNQ